MDTKNILLVGAVAALVPVIQNAAIEEPMSACGIEAEKSGPLACAPKQPAQHHVEQNADVPMYQPTVGVTVTPTYNAPTGVTLRQVGV
jgi:hypothetical protein